MQKLKPLPTVPRDYANELQDQLDAALQVLAALVLTEEEVRSINPDCAFADWSSMMKADLLGQRPRLVEALKAQGFTTNSDAGYCLSPLKERIPSPWLMSRVAEALEEVATEYVDGVGDELPEDMEEAKAIFSQMVRARVKDPHYAEALAPDYDATVAWLFSGSGVGTEHMLLAARKRLVHEARRKREEEEEE